MTNEKTTAPHPLYSELVSALAAATGLAAENVAGMLGRPPKPEMGDYAFPCFNYAKQAKMPPPAAAQKLAETLSQAVPQLSFETAGAFLNIRAKPGALPASVLGNIANSGADYGNASVGTGKTIVIDYSSPNIAKPFHVGHLMSTILGASLARIYRALGYKVEGVNHLGDWGVQCGFQFLAWFRADAAEREKQLTERGLDYLCDLYININQEAKANPSLETEARALFKKLEDGDAELKSLWERFRRETLAYLQKSYDRLGVKFESDAGEGFYEPLLKPLLKRLRESGVAIESQGALVIEMDEPSKPILANNLSAPKSSNNLSKPESAKNLPTPESVNGLSMLTPANKASKPVHKAPPFILLKSDEATIYGTRDLAAAEYRKQTYDFYKNLYVVDVRQSSHFQPLFKALAKMGHEWAKDCVHVSFGLMQVKEGGEVLAMTTRGGRMIPLNELLDKMVETVRKIVAEKNPDIGTEKINVVAEAVGVGAIIFWVQARRRASNFVFEWDKATDPTGDTGPYLQYTHARACSILRKAGGIVSAANLSLLVEPEESNVAKALELFPKVIQQAADDYEPSLISSYLLDLASAFGNFLNKHRVLDSAPELRAARLALVDAVRLVMARGLGLLGVAAPKEM